MCSVYMYTKLIYVAYKIDVGPRFFRQKWVKYG